MSDEVIGGTMLDIAVTTLQAEDMRRGMVAEGELAALRALNAEAMDALRGARTEIDKMLNVMGLTPDYYPSRELRGLMRARASADALLQRTTSERSQP